MWMGFQLRPHIQNGLEDLKGVDMNQRQHDLAANGFVVNIFFLSKTIPNTGNFFFQAFLREVRAFQTAVKPGQKNLPKAEGQGPEL